MSITQTMEPNIPVLELQAQLAFGTYRKKVKRKVTQSCPTLQPHELQPTIFLCSRDSPDKNMGVGCLCPPPRDLPHARDPTCSLTSNSLAIGFFTTNATWEIPYENEEVVKKIQVRIVSRQLPTMSQIEKELRFSHIKLMGNLRYFVGQNIKH